MRLTPWEEERLLIFSAAELARRHRAAGIALNAPEAIALMCDAMLEAARAGASYADVEAAGLAAVAPADVMPGVRELVDDVRARGPARRRDAADRAGRSAGRGAPADPDGPGAVVSGAGDAAGPAAALERRQRRGHATPRGGSFGSRRTSRSTG